MKNKINWAQFCAMYCIFGLIIGIFLILVGRAADPVAKVHLRSILSQHEIFQDGPARLVAWVDILEIYDKEAFQKRALKISKDGQRANLKEKIEGDAKDGIYYLYSNTGTLEATKRSNFWQNLLIWCIITTILTMVALKKKL